MKIMMFHGTGYLFIVMAHCEVCACLCVCLCRMLFFIVGENMSSLRKVECRAIKNSL